MTDRRTFLTAALIAPVAIAAPAIASVSATQHPEWLALLAEERRLDVIFGQMVDLLEGVERRYLEVRTVLTENWQRQMDDRNGKPWKFIQDRPSHESDEERTTAGVADHNAFAARMREERECLGDKARQEVGMAEAEAKWHGACDAHMASFHAVITYPSRDPAIIAHKMRMILDRFGDTNGDLRPLLASIVGETRA